MQKLNYGYLGTEFFYHHNDPYVTSWRNRGVAYDHIERQQAYDTFTSHYLATQHHYI